jgi:hypothetical protein
MRESRSIEMSSASRGPIAYNERGELVVRCAGLAVW